MEKNASGEAQVSMKDKVEVKVIRGANSWSYVYVALGFVLTIEGTFVSMVKPWKYPANVEIYATLTVVTTCLFLVGRRFRARLLRLKDVLESRPD